MYPVYYLGKLTLGITLNTKVTITPFNIMYVCARGDG